jgi:NAD-dependent SIR2 family protein deacetylase
VKSITLGKGQEPACQRAADLIEEADGLIVAAGAGMGADSGLPDFRGAHGFWRAYPALRKAGIRFEDIASPAAFRRHPRLAWGFYGHRLSVYRRTEPHRGFHLLRAWADSKPHGAFVFTSNVDGQFQKAGFSEHRVCEVHGSIHQLQCLENCGDAVWSADEFEPLVDESRCELVSSLPHCIRCGSIARPNVLMFGDCDWVSLRSKAQRARLEQWCNDVQRPVVIEVGAGTAIPTVRHFTGQFGVPYIRINLYEPEVRGSLGVGLYGRAAELLRQVDASLRRPPPDVDPGACRRRN